MPTSTVSRRSSKTARKNLVCDWAGSALKNESTFHQLSPYIGKLKSSIAASVISQFTEPGQLIYDPFSGSGTVAFEGWAANRRVMANDLSPYALALTRAKLFPPETLEEALKRVQRSSFAANRLREEVDLREVPHWVREFFHPETLRETIAWTTVLRRQRSWFLLAALLGILHHQRPGFLSFPSSHTVPYLRVNKFPRSSFPKLYEYRSLRDRLEAKVTRAFRQTRQLDFGITRACFQKDASTFTPPHPVDVIITSPPYMRLLDYGRDNRLRLWFLGARDWRSLDGIVSPGQEAFLGLMRRCFARWKEVLRPNHLCILVIGDAFSQIARARNNLPEAVSRIATAEVGGYERVCDYTEMIPNERRVRRGLTGSASETIVVLRSVGN